MTELYQYDDVSVTIEGRRFETPATVLFAEGKELPEDDERLFGWSMQSLERDVANHGIQEPIHVTESNRVIDGRQRLIVACRLKLPLSAIPFVWYPADISTARFVHLFSKLNPRYVDLFGTYHKKSRRKLAPLMKGQPRYKPEPVRKPVQRSLFDN